MATTGNAEIELLRPIEEITGNDDLEREGRYESAGTIMAWVLPIRAERALHAVGKLTDRALKLRFRAPKIAERITAGWRIEHNGESYEIRVATCVQGAWNVMAERV